MFQLFSKQVIYKLFECSPNYAGKPIESAVYCFIRRQEHRTILIKVHILNIKDMFYISAGVICSVMQYI